MTSVQHWRVRLSSAADTLVGHLYYTEIDDPAPCEVLSAILRQEGPNENHPHTGAATDR